MPSAKAGFAAIPNTKPPRFIDDSEMQGLQSAMHNRIAQRAYSHFERSGYAHGNDLDNWLRAENEVIQRGMEIRESGTWMAINASLPGVSAEDVQIYIERSRVIVRAERKALSEEDGGERRPPDGEEVFLLADLKIEADPSTASASLKNHKLTVMVQKRLAEAGKPESGMQTH